MDTKRLADLLLPNVTQTPADVEAQFPQRQLPEGAKVTRIAPSPTGFVHFGNLFPAIVSERLAHQSGGVFYLRIEDTDQKRQVEGAVDVILQSFAQYGLTFDEGVTANGERGSYGPYQQSRRADIYQAYAKQLILEGKAYPCFCTEEELEDIHTKQEAEKANFGYYGKWARWRDAALEDVQRELAEGKPFVLRFRSEGSIEHKIKHTDLVKGNMEVTENDIDHVLLKSDGIPTYHFAHVVDDHLMGTTHVVRGDEWLSTLPFHLQLFRAMGWKPPKYLHISPLMKQDGESKRKLSKRKDPEAALTFYTQQGYPKTAVYEYILTLLNSNFEEWRTANPDVPAENFPFAVKKMSVSGALFDLVKLRDVSKNCIARMSARQAYNEICAWAKNYDEGFYQLLTQNPDYAVGILNIGRGGKKPRKDIAIWSEAKDYMSFFYDDLFAPSLDGMPETVSKLDAIAILTQYAAKYNPQDDNNGWFQAIKDLSETLGYCSDVKQYKKDPSGYKGHVGDVSMVIRLAICGRTNSPDLYQVTQLLGRDRVIQRLNRAAEALKGEH